MTLKLIEKEYLTDNIWAFRFEPSKALSWVAGQYISVELPHENPDGEGTKRWFTISSAPYEKIVQITTRVTQSTFKQALSKLDVGAELQLLDTPHGDFVWQDSNLPVIFVAGGIGITCFRSILRQRAHDGLPLNVRLIYGNRTNDIVFKQEFDDYATADPNFTVQYIVGEPLTAARLTELVPNIIDTLVYIAGPAPVVAIGKKLRTAGLPLEQLKQDFYPAYTETNY